MPVTVTSAEAQMPLNANLTKTKQRNACRDICISFQRFFQVKYTDSVLQNQFERIFFSESGSQAFTFLMDGDALKCSYDKSKVGEARARDDPAFSKKVVEGFEEWLHSEDQKPIVIEIRAPQQSAETMDVGEGECDVQPQVDVQALQAEVIALREAQALRNEIERLKAAEPAPVAPENETLTKALKEVETLREQLETLRVAQEQQRAEIRSTAEKTVDAVNLATVACDQANEAKAQIKNTAAKSVDALNLAAAACNKAEQAKMNTQHLSRQQREASEHAERQTRLLAKATQMKFDEINSKVEGEAQEPRPGNLRRSVTIIRRNPSSFPEEKDPSRFAEEEEEPPTHTKKRGREMEEPEPLQRRMQQPRVADPPRLSPFNLAVFGITTAIANYIIPAHGRAVNGPGARPSARK